MEKGDSVFYDETNYFSSADPKDFSFSQKSPWIVSVFDNSDLKDHLCPHKGIKFEHQMKLQHPWKNEDRQSFLCEAAYLK